MAIHDEAMGEVIGRDSNGHLITNNHADLKALHLTTELGAHRGSVLQGDGIHTSARHVRDLTFKLY